MATFSDLANYNQNGFSIVAVRAEPDDLAEVLEGLADTVRYERSATIGKVILGAKGEFIYPDGGQITITARSDRRTSFLVRSNGSQWSILLRTLEWVEPADIDWIYDTAKALSKSLSTEAIAVAGSWECDCRHYENGNIAKKLSGVDPDKVAVLFDERRIEIPRCLIADDPPRLLATTSDAEQIDVAHEIQISVG